MFFGVSRWLGLKTSDRRLRWLSGETFRAQQQKQKPRKMRRVIIAFLSVKRSLGRVQLSFYGTQFQPWKCNLIRAQVQTRFRAILRIEGFVCTCLHIHAKLEGSEVTLNPKP